MQTKENKSKSRNGYDNLFQHINIQEKAICKTIDTKQENKDSNYFKKSSLQNSTKIYKKSNDISALNNPDDKTSNIIHNILPKKLSNKNNLYSNNNKINNNFNDNTNNEITIFINASISSEIINTEYRNYNESISEVDVNGKKSNINDYYNLLNKGINEITIKFNESLSTCFTMFYKLNNIVIIDTLNFDFSNVKSMDWMFEGCSSLKIRQ